MDIDGLFTHTKDIIHFNHASSAPLARPVRELMKELIEQLASGDLPWDHWRALLDSFRHEGARLMSCGTEEVGFIPNTSTGLLIALFNIPWEQGDNIVMMEDGFPANKVPWVRNLRGVERRCLPCMGDRWLEDRIIDAIDDRTRAVVVDWVDFFTGYRVDLEVLGELCSERGIFLVVDAMQGLGALELDLSKLKVDLLAAGSAKWLLGPVGAGLLYVNRGTMDRLDDRFQGWMAHDWKEFNIYDPLPPVKEGAGRFEVGSYPGIVLAGFTENLRILNSIGIHEIQRRIFGLRRLLVKGLQDRNANFISPLEERKGSGIVTFRPNGVDAGTFYRHLCSKNVVTSLRKEAIRLAPHFYNTEHDVQRFFSIIDDL